MLLYVRTKVGTVKYFKIQRTKLPNIMYALLTLACICSLKDNISSKHTPRLTNSCPLSSGNMQPTISNNYFKTVQLPSPDSRSGEKCFLKVLITLQLIQPADNNSSYQ